MGAAVLANFIEAVAAVLYNLLNFYFLIVVVAALISWVSPDPRNPIVRFLYSVTEPVLHQIRRRMPFVCAGGIDFSPIVLILAIVFLQAFVVRTLNQLAVQIRYALLPWLPVA